MERNNIIIICATLIVIVAIICGTVYLTSVKDTNLSISDTKVTKGDKITIALVDEDGNPLVNKNITINVTDSKNKTKSYNVTTNKKGKYNFKVKLSKGKYIFNVEYKGELLLRSSNMTKKVTVKEKEVLKQTTTYTSSNKKHPVTPTPPKPDGMSEDEYIELLHQPTNDYYHGKRVYFYDGAGQAHDYDGDVIH